MPYTERDFRAEFCGLDPAQFVDLLAMVGDSSDNIPGVEGIGPKTAPKLLEAYGNIEGCIANASAAKNKRVREVSVYFSSLTVCPYQICVFFLEPRFRARRGDGASVPFAREDPDVAE